MKKILGLLMAAAFIGLSVLAFTSTPSYALPNFAKKHEASCTLCHTVWPALNRFGENYLLNGFQMPDTEDGGDVGKIKPDEHVSLDTGSANPPLSARVLIETTLSQDTAVEGAGTDSRASLIEVKKAEVPFFLAGTLGKNLSYFVDNAAGSGDATATLPPEQIWVGIHNVGGSGTANIRYGLINTADFDAFSNHRHDLGGFLSEASGSNPAPDSHADRVGLQVYGRPGAGPLTYQVSFDNARANSNSLNLGLMARGDFGPLAVSLHLAGMSGKTAWGSAKDTSSTTTTIAARAIMTGYEVSFAFATNSNDPGTGTKTDTTGMVIEGIYFTEGYDIQARLSTASVAKASTQDTSQIALKFDYHATTNSKMFFKFVSDSKKSDYLKTTAGYNDGYISIGTDWAF